MRATPFWAPANGQINSPSTDAAFDRHEAADLDAGIAARDGDETGAELFAGFFRSRRLVQLGGGTRRRPLRGVGIGERLRGGVRRGEADEQRR